MLPIEVLEVVIDQASDNTASLRELSLACAAFLPRSRYHLFSSIVIRTVEQMESSRDFLDAHPWLLPLVHKATLSIRVPADNAKLIYDFNQNVRLLDVVPVHLLTRLPNLQTWTMEVLCPLIMKPSLSLHHSVLRCYRKYGSHIQDLRLFGVSFDGLSDFIGLVSAFTSIRSLACSEISFRMAKEVDTSLFVQGAGTLSRLPQISTLTVGTSMGLLAVESLLAGSGATLNDLTLQLGTVRYGEDYLERLEKSTSWAMVSRLLSLTFIVRPDTNALDDFSGLLHTATRILESVGRACLTNVRVEFEVNPIARFGHWLSGPDAPLEACKALEGALLTFPNPCVLVHDPIHHRRAGRAEFWSSVIQHAFPKLTERGILTLNFTRTKMNTPDPPGHEETVTRLVASHDSTRIVTAAMDGTIIIWDTSSGAVLQDWFAHPDGVFDLALSPDSRRLVSAGDCTVAVWTINGSVQKITELERNTGHLNAVACAWSPDGALVASASSDGTVHVWDGDTFQQRELVVGPEAPRSLRFSPDSRYLAWTPDHSCCIWRPLSGEQPTRLPSHPDADRGVSICGFSFDPESRRIATSQTRYARGRYGCVLRIWNVSTRAPLTVLSKDSHSESPAVTGISFSPDGRYLLSTLNDHSARVWDVESGEQIASFNNQDSGEACFSPDGTYIATGAGEGRVRLWRMGDGLSVADFAQHTAWVAHIAFSPNGEFLASADIEGVVHIGRLSNFIGH